MKFLHTMIRVTNIEESIDFYCNKLGLVEIRSCLLYTSDAADGRNSVELGGGGGGK